MPGIRDQRGAERGRAGCPPVLEIDLTDNDVLEPPVEWPPAPPTRRGNAHESVRRTATEPDVTALTTGRAARLLDASMSHLRTALEATSDEATSARIERALADVARARDTLSELDGA